MASFPVKGVIILLKRMHQLLRYILVSQRRRNVLSEIILTTKLRKLQKILYEQSNMGKILTEYVYNILISKIGTNLIRTLYQVRFFKPLT